MAARRLIAVLVVLLVVSSIAAALAPEARQVETTTTEPTAPNSQPGPDSADPEAEAKPEPEAEEIPAGTLVERTISADPGDEHAKQGKGASAPAEPTAIEAAVGDRVALQVDSEETVAIEIPGFGLLETAAPGAPARFDLLLREPGSYPVRIAGGATVGTIDVAEPGAGQGVKPGPGGAGEGPAKSSGKGSGKAPGGSGAGSGSSDTTTTTT